MITEFLLGLVATVWGWLGSLVPDWEMPEGLTDPGGAIEQIVSMAAGTGTWVNWPIVVGVALIPLGVWLIGLAWKTIRMIASHIPLFGGAG